jgi:hypothetical protein
MGRQRRTAKKLARDSHRSAKKQDAAKNTAADSFDHETITPARLSRRSLQLGRVPSIYKRGGPRQPTDNVQNRMIRCFSLSDAFCE